VIRQERWFLGCAVLIQLLAALANPHGVDVFRYVAGVLGNPVVRSAITEWQPPVMNDLAGGVFIASLVLSGVLLARGPRTSEFLALGFFALLGLLAVRNLAWWGLIAPPLLAHHLWRGTAPRTPAQDASNGTHTPATGSGSGWARACLNTILLCTLLTLALVSLPWTKHLNPLLPDPRTRVAAPGLPDAAADRLLSIDFHGRVFSFQPWGGFLEWRLWPKVQLMVDGRVELRPSEVWADYAAITSGDPSWQERLEQYEVKALVLSRRDQVNLLHRVLEAPDWRLVHQDQLSVVYVK